MKKQRSSCLVRLREQISGDDITKTLIGHLGSDQSAFIEEHMKKHRDIVDIIRQNLTAQDKILTWVSCDLCLCHVIWCGYQDFVWVSCDECHVILCGYHMVGIMWVAYVMWWVSCG